MKAFWITVLISSWFISSAVLYYTIQQIDKKFKGWQNIFWGIFAILGFIVSMIMVGMIIKESIKY